MTETDNVLTMEVLRRAAAVLPGGTDFLWAIEKERTPEELRERYFKNYPQNIRGCMSDKEAAELDKAEIDYMDFTHNVWSYKTHGFVIAPVPFEQWKRNFKFCKIIGRPYVGATWMAAYNAHLSKLREEEKL